MNRRQFFKFFGIGTVSVAIAPLSSFNWLFELFKPKTRKLKARWTCEYEQDLKGMHDIDAQAEMSRILDEELHAAIVKKARESILT